MNEYIKEQYILLKKNLENAKAQKVEEAKIALDNSVIAKKFEEFEAQKQNAYGIARDTYDRALQTATDICEKSKLSFKEAKYAEVENKINAAFATEISDIERKLEAQ